MGRGRARGLKGRGRTGGGPGAEAGALGAALGRGHPVQMVFRAVRDAEPGQRSGGTRFPSDYRTASGVVI